MFRSFFFCSVLLLTTAIASCHKSDASQETVSATTPLAVATDLPNTDQRKPVLDTAAFDRLQLHLAGGRMSIQWPVRAYPLPGAILPFHRVVAFYGNFYSRGMGILGELSEDALSAQLRSEVQQWEAADPLIPVIPAIHYIAVTAQRSPGKGSKYRLRMPDQQLDKALALARKNKGLLFLDVQIGHSTLQEELPALERYLSQPDVHLGIDPEYSMKDGSVPCAKIGTMDAGDINFAATYLAGLVDKDKLPPKILVIHRFTRDMVTDYRNIRLQPQVQIVVNMDGFGFPAKKMDSYRIAVSTEPVQFAGFKLFYKNDKLSKPYRLMTTAEILKLYPSPIYIQYQ